MSDSLPISSSSASPAPGHAPVRHPGVFTLQLPRQMLERTAKKFPEGVNVLVAAPEDLAPTFIRLPKAGCDESGQPYLCPVTSLPRSTLIDVLKRAGPQKVPCRHLRAPGATNGITLIPRARLIEYIESLPVPEWQEENEEPSEASQTTGGSPKGSEAHQ